jgi:hypothetical protein
MPYISMTGDAIGFFAFRVFKHTADDFLMTSFAIAQSDFTIERPDLDRLGETARSEGRAVVPAVDSFDGVFSDDVLWRVATVAGGRFFVAGTVPGVELLSHNVAVLTRLGVVREIGNAFSIEECKSRKAGEYTE